MEFIEQIKKHAQKIVDMENPLFNAGQIRFLIEQYDKEQEEKKHQEYNKLSFL